MGNELLKKVYAKASEDYQQDNAIMEIITNGQEQILDFPAYKHGYLSGAKRMGQESKFRIAELESGCDTTIKEAMKIEREKIVAKLKSIQDKFNSKLDIGYVGFKEEVEKTIKELEAT